MNHFDVETGKFLCPSDNYALDDEAVEDGDQGQEMKTKYVGIKKKNMESWLHRPPVVHVYLVDNCFSFRDGY